MQLSAVCIQDCWQQLSMFPLRLYQLRKNGFHSSYIEKSLKGVWLSGGEVQNISDYSTLRRHRQPVTLSRSQILRMNYNLPLTGLSFKLMQSGAAHHVLSTKIIDLVLVVMIVLTRLSEIATKNSKFSYKNASTVTKIG